MATVPGYLYPIGWAWWNSDSSQQTANLGGYHNILRLLSLTLWSPDAYAIFSGAQHRRNIFGEIGAMRYVPLPDLRVPSWPVSLRKFGVLLPVVLNLMG
ncbi:hypothetical protein BS47DRAFT_1351791 [Hydnum rufescens UP504]|uniref:Uncharacterized protein n=1 Tax=Hydnum rufescens UP504 TaxID=1448309 RepID=A0A9P6AL97_9AGAM|nr:hypothetical protein BS47DRAFT_1351791 [Hydnum rufescens UP504]